MDHVGAPSRDLLGCGGLRKKSFDLNWALRRTHPQPNRSRDILSLELYRRLDAGRDNRYDLGCLQSVLQVLRW